MESFFEEYKLLLNAGPAKFATDMTVWHVFPEAITQALHKTTWHLHTLLLALVDMNFEAIAAPFVIPTLMIERRLNQLGYADIHARDTRTRAHYAYTYYRIYIDWTIQPDSLLERLCVDLNRAIEYSTKNLRKCMDCEECNNRHAKLALKEMALISYHATQLLTMDPPHTVCECCMDTKDEVVVEDAKDEVVDGKKDVKDVVVEDEKDEGEDPQWIGSLSVMEYLQAPPRTHALIDSWMQKKWAIQHELDQCSELVAAKEAGDTAKLKELLARVF